MKFNIIRTRTTTDVFIIEAGSPEGAIREVEAAGPEGSSTALEYHVSPVYVPSEAEGVPDWPSWEYPGLPRRDDDPILNDTGDVVAGDPEDDTVEIPRSPEAEARFQEMLEDHMRTRMEATGGHTEHSLPSGTRPRQVIDARGPKTIE